MVYYVLTLFNFLSTKWKFSGILRNFIIHLRSYFSSSLQHSTRQSSGQITFGSADTSNCANNWQFVSLIANDNSASNQPMGAWRFPITGIKIGDTFTKHMFQVASLGTDDFFLRVPEPIFAELVQITKATYVDEKINGIPVYSVNCESVDALPPITIEIGENDYTVLASTYVIKVSLALKQAREIK